MSDDDTVVRLEGCDARATTIRGRPIRLAFVAGVILGLLVGVPLGIVI